MENKQKKKIVMPKNSSKGIKNVENVIIKLKW